MDYMYDPGRLCGGYCQQSDEEQKEVTATLVLVGGSSAEVWSHAAQHTGPDFGIQQKQKVETGDGRKHVLQKGMLSRATCRGEPKIRISDYYRSKETQMILR
jgi:hypothetical protein